MVHQAGKIKDQAEKKKFLDWLWDYEFNLFSLPVPDQVFFLNIPPEINQQLIKNRKNKITGQMQKDIHEKSSQHLIDAYTSALELIARYDWTEIRCVKNESLRSIDDIQAEIRQAVFEKRT
jgi:dTMP kinase